MTAVTQLDDYAAFCDGVRALTGIDLHLYRRGQMERRVRSFVRVRDGNDDLARYLRRLRVDAPELDAFLDRLTINVSQLWRNPGQWQLLRREVLPELAAHGRIRAWSAGCSYGAEAYTLAALCLDALPAAGVSILGTDIDARMVARARDGWFSAADARSAPHAELVRNFERDGDGWRASDALRSVVRFETGDLLHLRVPAERYDLVLCRNTVIYFTEDVRDALHEQLVRSLASGGYLLVGSTERVAGARDLGLEPVGPFLYRRR